MDNRYNVLKYSLDSASFRRLIGILFLMICLVAIVLELFSGYLVSEKDTLNAVEKQGYKDVIIYERHQIGPGFYGCDGRDAAAFKARAINPSGQKVDIIICSGLFFKGVTVRTK